ncbi:MAG: hypothetical protein MMC23_005066 [Stictis urceolatum]|nr:hypothetical protein [Stictis urceolata]
MNSKLAVLLLAAIPALAYDPTASVDPTGAHTTTIASNAPLGTAYNGAQHLDLENNPPPLVTPSPKHGAHADAAAVDIEAVTVNVFNSMTAPVNVLYVSGFGSPSLVDNPAAGAIAPAAATQFVVPANFIGQSTFGIDGDDSQGTKSEFSLSPDPNQNNDHIPYVDVSYVDGYSVPMTCSCNGAVVTGCNIELFNTGITCDSLGPGPVCYNPNAHQPESFTGPAAPFFAPCQGAAYTFPADDASTMGCPGATEIDCCIGATCPAPARQAPAPAKRSALRHAVRGDSY